MKYDSDIFSPESYIKRIHFSVDMYPWQNDINGSVHDCSNFIANALELLQSCTKPSV